MTSSPATTPASGSGFAHTRWTLVLRADAGSATGRTALAELCAAYYQPVFVFLCRLGFDADAARDHAHSFFADLLERGFRGPSPEKGRFRNYLLGAVKYFIGDLQDRARRAKRGGYTFREPLLPDEEGASALQIADPKAPAMPEVFDREWAVTVMNRTMAALAAEHTGARRHLFDVLHPWLIGNAAGSQRDASRTLGLSECAVKAAVHRLRRRFRELLREEIAQTLEAGASVEEELRYLCLVLGK